MGLPLEASQVRRSEQSALGNRTGLRLIQLIERLTIRQWLFSWIALVTAGGIAYWLLSQTAGHGLRSAGIAVDKGLSGLLTSFYFSVVTATSLGYGDIVPVGVSRAIAVAEATLGMLVFGAVIAKVLSHRQGQLVQELHSITFQERLGRVQTSLHLLVADFHTISVIHQQQSLAERRIAARVKSAAMLLERELRSVRDLLHQPDNRTDEATLETILTTLDAALGEFVEIIDAASHCRSQLDNLTAISSVANEICSDCVPVEYAPRLQLWMDRVHRLAESVGSLGRNGNIQR